MAGGGAERQVAILAAAQVAAGDEIHVALVRGGPNLAILDEAGASLHWIPAWSYYDPGIVPRLRRILREVKPAIVQSWVLQMDVAAGIAALSSGIPWVLCERVSAGHYQKSPKAWLRVQIGSHASAIVANSSVGADYWRSRRTANLPTFVIPNAVPFASIAGARAAVDGSLPCRPLILFGGRLVSQKNPTVMIEAMVEVLRRIDGCAMICGDGPEAPQLLRLVQQSGMAQRIHIVGYRADFWSVMKSAAVFVSVSLFEGQPNAVLEAMACRCPLVVSDIPEHREFLDEHSAWLPSPASKRDIARAIEEALTRPDVAGQKAEAAWSRVQRYTPESCAEQYGEVYRQVIDKGGSNR